MDATPGAPRKRALFISSYDIPCGIANFTEGLMSHLRHRFDVEVAALDQVRPTLDGPSSRAGRR